MNHQQILVIGDDPLSCQMLQTLLRDKGYGNVIAGNHYDVMVELEAKEAQRQAEKEMLVDLGNLFVGFQPIIQLKTIKNFDIMGDIHGWTYDRKPPPHYRVNFRTGKPLRY